MADGSAAAACSECSPLRLALRPVRRLEGAERRTLVVNALGEQPERLALGLVRVAVGNQIADPRRRARGPHRACRLAGRPRRDMPGVLASGVIFLVRPGLQDKARGCLNTGESWRPRHCVCMPGMWRQAGVEPTTSPGQRPAAARGTGVGTSPIVGTREPNGQPRQRRARQRTGFSGPDSPERADIVAAFPGRVPAAATITSQAPPARIAVSLVQRPGSHGVGTFGSVAAALNLAM